jgi:hypothetical protein
VFIAAAIVFFGFVDRCLLDKVIDLGRMDSVAVNMEPESHKLNFEGLKRQCIEFLEHEVSAFCSRMHALRFLLLLTLLFWV